MEKLKTYLQSDQPRKWLFYGDSITHGTYHTNGWHDYTQIFAERLRCGSFRPMDLVLNSAISGNTTRQLLETFDWRVASLKPDVVWIMIGMNDCAEKNNITVEEFGTNLVELVEKIRALGAEPVLQTTCPILPGSAPPREPYFPGFMDQIREAAGQQKVILVDHLRYWQERSEWHYLWMSDTIHPNEFGHRAFAKKLLLDLDLWDPAHYACKFYLQGD